MKVLTIVGAPVGVRNEFKESRPLAYIYNSRWPKFIRSIAKKQPLVVKPATRELAPFAKAVEQRITDRLVNHPSDAFVYSARDPENPHARKIATADDPDLLEAIWGDPLFWNEYSDGIVAGYYVLSGYSKIEDR